jgi:cob(I)alamin adenosyltransferase
LFKLKRGLVEIYTGNGRGKTTAALGLALRATGHGLRVCMIQFMKGRSYGELKSATKLGLKIIQFGQKTEVNRNRPSPKDIERAQNGLKYAKEAMTSEEFDIVILDELNCAIDWKLLDVETVLDVIRQKPPGVELIITGRYARPEIIELADLVTEMREIKHPFQKGIPARKGIEW